MDIEKREEMMEGFLDNTYCHVHRDFGKVRHTENCPLMLVHHNSLNLNGKMKHTKLEMKIKHPFQITQVLGIGVYTKASSKELLKKGENVKWIEKKDHVC